MTNETRPLLPIRRCRAGKSRYAAVLCAVLCAVLLSCTATRAALPDHTPIPGGIAVVDLGPTRPQSVSVAGVDVAIIKEGERWFAIAGIALDTESESVSLTVVRDQGTRTRRIPITPHPYREQHLTIKQKSYVNPDAAQLQRYRQERAIMDAARARRTPVNAFALFDHAPVDGVRSDSFGARRFFNGQPRNPHSGMDIAASSGTPVVAPGDAEVAAVGDFFFNGKTVMLDHGAGLISLYCHLSQINVAAGDTIAAAQTLGRVGATGRVTGAHLHWSVYLNGVAVNPALMLGTR